MGLIKFKPVTPTRRYGNVSDFTEITKDRPYKPLLGLILESRVHWLLPAMGAMVVPALVTFFTARTLELPTRADS